MIKSIYDLNLHFNWQPAAASAIRLPNQQLNDWICYPGSMTERLTNHFHDISIDVWQQGEQAISEQDAHTIAHNGHRAHVRDVVIYIDEKPWIAARTIVGLAGLRIVL